MSTLTYLTQGTSAVYHLSTDGKTPLCEREITSKSKTGSIPKNQRPCSYCMSKVSRMITNRSTQREKNDNNILESLQSKSAITLPDKNSDVILFSDFPSLIENVIEWAKSYCERKPEKYKALLCIYHNKPFHAILHYKGSDKIYKILLPGRDKYYRSQEWRELSQKVFDRDNHTCRLCGSTVHRLTAHHITYDRFGHEDLKDLTSLCYICHNSFHNGGTLRT